MKRLLVIGSWVGIFALAVGVTGSLFSQRPNRARQQQQQREKSLSEHFQGVTATGKAKTGLFKIKSTGVSTEPVRVAAQTFLDSLSKEQASRTKFPVDDLEWRKWDNRHRYPRQGVGFNEMSKEQRKLAFAMLRASLSAKGLKKTQDIMKLNGTLAELTKRFDEYGEWLYWITIMGEPSSNKPWGWQLDGHHVVINYFVLGDQVVMTPVFMGSEPIKAESGKFKGTVVMQEEQNKGLELIKSLNATQRADAIIRSSKGPTNNLTEAFRDNVVLDYAGIKASQLDHKQRQLLLDLISKYVGNMFEGHARVKMSEVKQHLDETYFAWMGGTNSNSVYYYRIQSPVILIEFDHQRPIALGRSSVPTRNHIHTVVRTPNGNDYGKELLRQHFLKHHHGKSEHSHPHK